MRRPMGASEQGAKSSLMARPPCVIPAPLASEASERD